MKPEGLRCPFFTVECRSEEIILLVDSNLLGSSQRTEGFGHLRAAIKRDFACMCFHSEVEQSIQYILSPKNPKHIYYLISKIKSND